MDLSWIQAELQTGAVESEGKALQGHSMYSESLKPTVYLPGIARSHLASRILIKYILPN